MKELETYNELLTRLSLFENEEGMYLLTPSQRELIAEALSKEGWKVEPSPPMEVKDAEAAFKEYWDKDMQAIYKDSDSCKILAYHAFRAGSQLQPPVISEPTTKELMSISENSLKEDWENTPVISAEVFLKEKHVQNRYIETKDYKGRLAELLTEYLQRQGQKTNQNKL